MNYCGDYRGPYPCDDCETPCDEWSFEACCRLCRWRGENICDTEGFVSMTTYNDRLEHQIPKVVCDNCRENGENYYCTDDGLAYYRCAKCVVFNLMNGDQQQVE